MIFVLVPKFSSSRKFTLMLKKPSEVEIIWNCTSFQSMVFVATDEGERNGMSIWLEKVAGIIHGSPGVLANTKQFSQK